MELRYDELENLERKIHSLHLGYLDAGEHREENRRRLIKYVKEFLNVAPHGRKFQLSVTSEVLRKSVTRCNDFSGAKAARAWAALGRYADNLLAAPWRKEYKEIKLYSGFYKHNVETGLLGADIMLEAMGYKRYRNSTMVLEDILDPDQVTSVSQDALYAEVECIIMEEIWKHVERHGISWADILDYRERYTGSADHAKRSLHYQLQMRNSHARSNSMSGPGYGTDYNAHYYVQHQPPPQPQPALPYGIPGFNGPTHIPTHPFYSSYYNTQPPCSAFKPPETCYTNGYNYGYNSALYGLPSNHSVCHQPHIPSYPTTVPTAQLIELEPPAHSYNHNQSFTSLTERVNNSQFLSSKAKDDGAGQWEDWDNTYKLSRGETRNKVTSTSTRYNDDTQLSEQMRGMILAQSNVSRRYDSTRTEGDGAVRVRVNKSSFELEDAVPSHRLNKNSSESESDAIKLRKSKKLDDECPKSINVENGGRKQGRILLQNNILDEKEEIRDSLRISELAKPKLEGKSKRESKETNCYGGVHVAEASAPLVVTLDVSPQFLKDISPVVDLPPERWECTTCTFINTNKANVCEMCAKSRVSGDIKPPPGGGRECPNCTLVNDRGKNFCAACHKSLKDSPTYI